MPVRRFVSFSVLFVFLFAPASSAQLPRQESPDIAPASIIEMHRNDECSVAPTEDALPSLCIPAFASSSILANAETNPPVATLDLLVPAGTALRIATDQRVRISHAGEIVHGTVVESVFAFDQEVIPAGSIATGRIIKVAAVSRTRRTLAYANGDFSPFHKNEVTFDTVILPNGKRIPVKTTVSPGTTEMVHLVTNTSNQKQKSGAERAAETARQEAKGKVVDAKGEIRKSWDAVVAPGRLDRVKRLLLAQSPYRRQYLDAGTRFNADLEQSISFGKIERSARDLFAIGSALVPDTTLKARLVAEVSSATATRGKAVNAVVTEPLYSPSHQLILPANSKIVGEVVQSEAAHKFHRNGELRVIFQRIEIPADVQRAVLQTSQAPSEHLVTAHSRVAGNLEGVEVDRKARMTLDEEGRAHTTDSKTRYLSTGLAILLAAAASHQDTEHGTVDSAGDPGVRTAAGGSGFRLVGAAISFAAKSSPISIAFGVYGASESVYINFLSRGHEVVLPKDTALEIGFGNTHSQTGQAISEK